MTDPSQLRRLLAGVRLLMLDFDGPVCRIFAGYPAPVIADELRHLVASRGLPLTDDLLSTTDPLQVLRLVEATGTQALTVEVASALREAEVRATKTAKQTPGLLGLIDAAAATNRMLAIVSNNSREAVASYLRQHGLTSRFAALTGRLSHELPSLLKPHPHLLQLALAEAQVEPHHAVFVGDSVTDILAAKAASVVSIGFRPYHHNMNDLVRAGANATVDSLHQLAAALLGDTE